MLVLGIETSCDETAVAVVDGDLHILSNVIASQAKWHAATGGIVPEVAARQHMEAILPTVRTALSEAGVGLDDISGIAVTSTHGLIGCLLIGVECAKALAYAAGKPLIGVHHIEGHIYAPFLTKEDIEFPHLCLTVSGGHTSLVKVHDHHEYEVLGETLDDAAGEAFDKGGKLLGLPFPGGPEIDKLSGSGNAKAFAFPRPLKGSKSWNFSFSGLKTALMRQIELDPATERHADLAASFQEAIADTLCDKLVSAALEFDVPMITLTGGVAANSRLREMVTKQSAKRGLHVVIPRPGLCTDNGAMIACAGQHRFQAGYRSELDLDAKAVGAI